MSVGQSRAGTAHVSAAEQRASPRRLGLPRTARLLDTRCFDWVFAAPRRSSDQYFTVLGRAAPVGDGQDPSPRLGLAIAKRCAPRAVSRNRIKRVIRESFRHVRGSLKPMDLIVLCRPAAIDADNATLSASLVKHWKRFQR